MNEFLNSLLFLQANGIDSLRSEVPTKIIIRRAFNNFLTTSQLYFVVL